MRPLGNDDLTDDEVREALSARVRNWSVAYDILDAAEAFLGTLGHGRYGGVFVEPDASLSWAADQTSGSSLKFKVYDDGSVDWDHVRIRPRFRLAVGEKIREWHLGIFVPLFPERERSSLTRVFRDLDIPDKSFFVNNCFTAAGLFDTVGSSPFGNSFRTGQSAVGAAERLLRCGGLEQFRFFDPGFMLTVDQNWPVGDTSKTWGGAANELLKSVNARSFWLDGDGVAVAQQIIDPATAPADWLYFSGDRSLIVPPIKDVWVREKIKNACVVEVADKGKGVWAVTYVNNDPKSPTSTVSLGYYSTMTVKDASIPDVESALLRGKIELQRSTSLALTETLTALPSPIHEPYDTIGIRVGDESANFTLLDYELPLTPNGSPMTLTLGLAVDADMVDEEEATA